MVSVTLCQEKPTDQTVFFTDENKFTLSMCDRLEGVWKCCGEHYAACNFILHDWFSSSQCLSTVEGLWRVAQTSTSKPASTLAVDRYRDEILRAIVRPHTGAVDPGFLLVQDNAQPRVARVERQFIDDEGIDATGSCVFQS